MGKFIIAGITQLETIVKVDKIPLEFKSFNPLSDSIHTAAGGDAYNISLALKWLGDDIKFMSVVGRDQSMGIFNPPEREVTLDTDFVLPAGTVMVSSPEIMQSGFISSTVPFILYVC